MQLYSFFNSSTSYRIRIVLALKGIQYQYQGVNIRVGEQSTSQYIEINPSKGVPVLKLDNGETISQSMAILHYLDQFSSKNPLLPGELMAQTRVLEFCNIIACDMHPVNNLRILKYLTGELFASDQQKQTWYKHWISEGMSALEAHLNKYGTGNYCFGDTPTLADVCLVPQIANAQRFGCDLSAYGRSLEIFDHCQKHPAFIAAEPSNQPDYIQ